MKRVAWLGVLLLLVTLPTRAAVPAKVSLELETTHEYVDDKKNESFGRALSTYGKLHFSADVENGVAVRATLTFIPQAMFETKVVLGPVHIKDIALYQDSEGRYWLERFKIAGTALAFGLKRWIENDIARMPVYFKVVPMEPTSVPGFFELVFDTEFLGDGASASNSNYVSFAGHRVDGVRFKAKFVARQSQSEAAEPKKFLGDKR